MSSYKQLCISYGRLLKFKSHSMIAPRLEKLAAMIRAEESKIKERLDMTAA